jgi:hypothetical protein
MYRFAGWSLPILTIPMIYMFMIFFGHSVSISADGDLGDVVISISIPLGRATSA